MRLSHIHETGVSRRDFLRKSGGAISVLTGNWKRAIGLLDSNPTSGISSLAKLFNSLSGDVQSHIRHFVFSLVNADMWGPGGDRVYPGGSSIYDVKDGMIDLRVMDKNGKLEKLIPVPAEAITGYIASTINSADAYDTANVLLTGGNPEYIDKMVPGFLSAALEFSVKKHGPKEFIDGLVRVNHDLGYTLWQSWELALGNSTLQKFTELTPEIIRQAEKTGRGLAQMVDKGIISRQDAIDHRQYHNTKRWKKQQNEKLEQERSEQEKPEKFEKPHDYGVASPMHQWVENKSRFEAELDRVLLHA